MTKPEVEVYIEKLRRYLIAKTLAPFNKGKKAVDSAEGGKFKIPRIWLNQQVREERGYEDDVSKNGNWVLEGILYVKDKRIINPTGLSYLHPNEAVKSHSQGGEYTLETCTQDEIERAIANGLEIKADDLDSDGDLVIPCKDFGSNQYSLFLFGGEGKDKEKSKRAENSGEWLIKSPQEINKITLYLDKQKNIKKVGKDYATQMWFRDLNWRSGLVGWGWGLHCDDRVLGVFDSAEGSAKNFE